MDTGSLDVLTDSVQNQLTTRGNGINIDFLSTVNELGDDNRVLGGNLASRNELVVQLLLGVDHVHSCAREDIARTDENRITDSVRELLSLSHRSQFLPGGLINPNAIKDLRELVTVLSLVDILGISSKNLCTTSFLETEGNVLRQLATDRDNYAAGILEFVDIHDALVAEFLEIHLIDRIEISAYRLRVELP